MSRARLIAGGLVLLAILVVAFAFYHGGETAGAGAATSKAEQQHTVDVAAARQDERSANQVAAAIEQRVAHTDDLSTAAVQATIKDLRDALDAVPPAPAGAPVPAAPVDGLRDGLNQGIARANRSADTADAVS